MLYLFNPDNDLALADADVNYMPPASIRKMMEDLAMLPVWYAFPGSLIFAHTGHNREWMHHLGFTHRLITEVEPEEVDAIIPWGWNPALRKQLLKAGFAENLVPSEQQMKQIRELSGRKTTMLFLEHFYPMIPDLLRLRQVSSEVELRAIREESIACLLKSPWSGSGRGLRWCRQGITEADFLWALHVLRRQGSLMVEPIYNKVEDFALELWVDTSEVQTLGYSLFDTKHGVYQGNSLCSDDELKAHLAHYVGVETFERVHQAQCEMCVRLLQGRYEGYVGIDMMICRSEQNPSRCFIHPCVEVNLRTTMGVVANRFYRNYAADGVRGKFHVHCFASPQELQSFHRRKCSENELKGVQPFNGHWHGGYLPLVPMTSQTTYWAWVD